jgi:hypothetical protein
MPTKRFELEERRVELTRALPALSENQARTYRRSSDARALARAGVKLEQPQELVQLDEAEIAARTAIRDAQRELRDVELEIERLPRAGFGARVARTFRQGRTDQ